MAEDQTFNGDVWNKQASILLKKFKWEQIGDSNIDVIGDDSSKIGVDRLFKILDLNRSGRPELVVVEAKRYNTSSYKKNSLSDWVTIIDNKLNKIRSSGDFRDTYGVDGLSLRIGLIVIWFHDVDNFKSSKFQQFYNETLLNVKPSAHPRKAGSNRIYVLTNDIILKLCSMLDHISKFENEHSVELKFLYPGSTETNRPISRSTQLTIDYFLSKFILLESTSKDDIQYNIVFYFGAITLSSFKRLSSALYGLKFVDQDKKLIIYHYENNDEFRKYKPEIEKLFPNINFQLKKMVHYHTLPPELDSSDD
jgi:hypothetical protein